MPERPPAEDPFADLFGKLPDPRARASMTARDAAADASTSGPDHASQPLSRRAAREAAARDEATTGSSIAGGRAVASPAASAGGAAPVEARGGAPGAAPTTPTSTTGQVPRRASARNDPTPATARGSRSKPPRTKTATLDDLFTGQASTDSLGSAPPPPDKKKRRIGGVIVLGLILVLIGGIAGGGLWVWNTYEDRIRAFMGWEEPRDYDAGVAEGDVTVTIASGDNGQSISALLYEAGVTKTSTAFYEHLIDTGQNPTFYPGAFKLQKKMTSEAALAALENPANKLENTVQLREGLTVKDSVPVISESLGIPLAEVEAAVADPAVYGVPAASLEGWLFPATYTFDPGLTATDIIRTLVDQTVASLDAAGVPADDRERVLTIASIIQREARYEQDFYKVSRVIQNRLDPGNTETFGLLQMDSTAQYGVGEDDGTVSSSEEALTDDNPWNTYVRTGLPVGPISNPGAVAIDAAMHPVDGPWLYFVTVNLNTGETVFTTNLAEHNATVEQFLAWCTENPDAGC